MTYTLTISFLALALLIAPSTSYSCMNEHQQPVDWMIALRVHGKAGPRKYVVLDSTNKKWRETTETALVGPIFGQINAKKDLVTAWNDEPPTGKSVSTSYAHAKGVLAFSTKQNSGLYYMHSIPKYPQIDTATGKINYLSPASSSYGQSIVCQTISSQAKARSILSQVVQSKPYLYYNTFGIDTAESTPEQPTTPKEQKENSLSQALESLTSSFKNLKQDFKSKNLTDLTTSESLNSLKELFNSKNLNKKTKQNSEPISQRVGGFTFVTKPKPLTANIFEGFLSPYWTNSLDTNVGFYIETWGRPLIESDCAATNPMINIRRLKIGSESQKETQDHSKWAISVKKELKLVCIGDLNHQTSQAHRGGSFLCLQDGDVYNQFASLITEHDCTTYENNSSQPGKNIKD